ncbi:Uncharacterized protein Rs2_00869 [Raphanus sativus]|nr:Uncharacterized protein Rs2_00869 [Raphanus sativus]
MVMTANVNLDSPESYRDKEIKTRSKIAIQRILTHRKSMKKKKKRKPSVKRRDSETDDDGGKKSKKRKKHKVSGGEDIVNTGIFKDNQSHEKALVLCDDDIDKRDKRWRVVCTTHKPKKKRSMLAKIVMKRGVQLTASERLAEDFKKLTGGILLSRNKDYLVFYQGKNVLLQEVTETLKEQEKFVRILGNRKQEAHSREGSSTLHIVKSTEPSNEFVPSSIIGETLDTTGKWRINQDDGHHAEEVKQDVKKQRHKNLVRKLKTKFYLAERRLLKARRGLAKVEECLQLAEQGADLESINCEEGMEGVSTGTIGNIGIEYKSLLMLRLKKKKALARPIKVQRREEFTKHTSAMRTRAERLGSETELMKKIADFKRVKKLITDVRFEHVSSRETLLSSREQMRKKELLLEEEFEKIEEQNVSVLSCMHIFSDARTEVEMFRWPHGRTERYKKPEICQTYSKLKKICQVCQVDLENNLLVQDRDMAPNITTHGKEKHFSAIEEDINHKTALLENETDQLVILCLEDLRGQKLKQMAELDGFLVEKTKFQVERELTIAKEEELRIAIENIAREVFLIYPMEESDNILEEREGRRVSDEPYTLESGEEVRPLMVELPADSVEAKVTKKVKKSGETFYKYFANSEKIRRNDRASELSTWMDSVLFKEKNTEATRQLEVKLRTRRPSNIFAEKENTGVAESWRKRKRLLVKPSTSRNLIKIDSDTESDSDRHEYSAEKRINSPINNENMKDCVLEQEETSARKHPRDSATKYWDDDEIEESENWSHKAAFKRPRSVNADDESNFEKLDSRRDETEATKKVLLFEHPEMGRTFGFRSAKI